MLKPIKTVIQQQAEDALAHHEALMWKMQADGTWHKDVVVDDIVDSVKVNVKFIAQDVATISQIETQYAEAQSDINS